MPHDRPARTLHRHHLSAEFVPVRVRMDDDDTDPTAFTVEAAMVDPGAEPTAQDWHPAQWNDDGPPYRALTLVGPGTNFVPSEGTAYDLLIRISAGVETVVRRAVRIVFD